MIYLLSALTTSNFLFSLCRLKINQMKRLQIWEFILELGITRNTWGPEKQPVLVTNLSTHRASNCEIFSNMKFGSPLYNIAGK
jgi:hypothetical protein